VPLSPASPLFEFALTALSDVEPWIESGQRTLHWFALSQGRYWINAGSARLFEPREPFNDTARWQYYLARFWSDILEMLPATLEHVPEDVARRVQPEEHFPRLELEANRWMNSRGEATEIADFDLLQTALNWANERQVNTGYWIGGPKIWFVRSSDTVRISWDNRALTCADQPLWTADAGTFDVPVEDFRHEVIGFHQRLISAMSSRIDELLGAPSRASDLRVDRNQISTEQVARTAALERAFEGVKLRVPTDWTLVRGALALLDAQLGNSA
jgi:hypothetical protein